MASVWLASSLWIGLALAASLLSIWVAVSVALVEILVAAVAGNLIGLPLSPWVNFLAGFGAILLTFLAGAEIDPQVVRKHFWSSMSIGIVSFFAPYLGVLFLAHYAVGWPWRHRLPGYRCPPPRSPWFTR
jgi:Kef-type K+ transport system membrane component KefB